MRTSINRVKIVTTVRKKHEIEVDADFLRKALANTGIDVPKGAKIEFVVPGGGDWSNTAIDIDEDHPILVSWEESETEVKET